MYCKFGDSVSQFSGIVFQWPTCSHRECLFNHLRSYKYDTTESHYHLSLCFFSYKQHSFQVYTIKISLLEICFITTSHHNMWVTFTWRDFALQYNSWKIITDVLVRSWCWYVWMPTETLHVVPQSRRSYLFSSSCYTKIECTLWITLVIGFCQVMKPP